MKFQSNPYCVAMYLRVSKDDGDFSPNKTESNSISSQRMLLTDYIRSLTFVTDTVEYCDDGYTGTNFNRPAFIRMMEDVIAGKVQCIVVKDLSRLGRDYIEVGNILEHIFPCLGVRIISVNDHYDSDSHKGQTAGIEIALKNLIYDIYSKDLSEKVRASIGVRQKQAEYVTNAPYGYKVDSAKKHHLVIDEETAAVVRDIFRLRLQGYSITEIAEILNKQGVLTPAAYLHTTGRRRLSHPSAPHLWTYQIVHKLLNNIKYTGTMVNRTTRKRWMNDTSYQRLPKEQWYFRDHAHEAIIRKEDFAQVQAMQSHPSRRAGSP